MKKLIAVLLLIAGASGCNLRKLNTVERADEDRILDRTSETMHGDPARSTFAKRNDENV